MKPMITFPCLQARLVPREQIVANGYNPNSVPPDKMKLLRQSIVDNGFCFPIVTIWDADQSLYVIIDGFHRWIICQPEWLDIEQVPIVVLEHDISARMIATKQFNAARGFHQVDLDAELVRALIEQGLSEEEIAQRLQMDSDTIHRYKQLTGVAELFKNSAYSVSWEMVEEEVAA